MILYNTKTEKIGGIYYCLYCGKEATFDYEYEDRKQYDYHFCDCENAKLEIEKKKIEDTINSNTRYNKHKVQTELNLLRYENEMRQLKRKYNISE